MTALLQSQQLISVPDNVGIGEPIATVGLDSAGFRVGNKTHGQRLAGRLLRLKLRGACPPVLVVHPPVGKVKRMHHAGTEEPVIPLIGHKLGVGADPVKRSLEILGQTALDNQICTFCFELNRRVIAAKLRVVG